VRVRAHIYVGSKALRPRQIFEAIIGAVERHRRAGDPISADLSRSHREREGATLKFLLFSRLFPSPFNSSIYCKLPPRDSGDSYAISQCRDTEPRPAISTWPKPAKVFERRQLSHCFTRGRELRSRIPLDAPAITAATTTTTALDRRSQTHRFARCQRPAIKRSGHINQIFVGNFAFLKPSIFALEMQILLSDPRLNSKRLKWK
jgi:hypothetical protein